ncbi:hypothetical protein [Pedobacter caeni]|uniref:Uncharacterized protein n=1 Tax=Pedobacter caeni TaxID=288992 RepID=A0A1M5H788_9SPHI|nr:hypothetical protein [Pedobacter caeni]SHG11804.1 hypothetical protein SAMN04488522_104534 [Pedobacter caeni]
MGEKYPAEKRSITAQRLKSFGLKKPEIFKAFSRNASFSREILLQMIAKGALPEITGAWETGEWE